MIKKTQKVKGFMRKPYIRKSYNRGSYTYSRKGKTVRVPKSRMPKAKIPRTKIPNYRRRDRGKGRKAVKRILEKYHPRQRAVDKYGQYH